MCIPILGGVFFSRLMGGLPHERPGGKGTGDSATIISAGVRGVGATALALEGFFLLASVFLAFRASLGGVDPVLGFVGYFIGIQTYGLVAVFASLPFAFAYGTVAGLLLNWYGGRPRG